MLYCMKYYNSASGGKTEQTNGILNSSKRRKKKRKNTPTKNNKDHIIISVRLSTLKQIFKKTQNVKLSTIVKYNTNKMIC